MPNWAQVLKEIENESAQPVAFDKVRRRYLRLLHEKTGRNIIAYYSGWLMRRECEGVEISDEDINGFMTVIHGMDCSRGLDIILHTPGGVLSAAEHLVYYLKTKFGNDIRAIVPQIAMSAGTMIACACKSIIMGRQSCLGPTDPRLGGVSARGVYEEFQRALEAAKKEPETIPIWQTIVAKYHPTFIDECLKAYERSSMIVRRWLKENMLSNLDDASISSIVGALENFGHNEGHDKHIAQSDAAELGLVIQNMEDDQELQDLILTVHHTYMHTFSGARRLTKIIENQDGIAMFLFGEPSDTQ